MNEKTPSERLAEQLKDLRLAHGYKQADIAGAIGINQATYSNYELGKRTPGSMILYRIANFYGLPVDDLLKLSIPLDNEIYYEAPAPSVLVEEKKEFLEYIAGAEKESLSRDERELLFHFGKLPVKEREEVLDFVRFKREQKNRNNRIGTEGSEQKPEP